MLEARRCTSPGGRPWGRSGSPRGRPDNQSSHLPRLPTKGRPRLGALQGELGLGLRLALGTGAPSTKRGLALDFGLALVGLWGPSLLAFVVALSGLPLPRGTQSTPRPKGGTSPNCSQHTASCHPFKPSETLRLPRYSGIARFTVCRILGNGGLGGGSLVSTRFLWPGAAWGRPTGCKSHCELSLQHGHHSFPPLLAVRPYSCTSISHGLMLLDILRRDGVPQKG